MDFVWFQGHRVREDTAWKRVIDWRAAMNPADQRRSEKAHQEFRGGASPRRRAVASRERAAGCGSPARSDQRAVKAYLHPSCSARLRRLAPIGIPSRPERNTEPEFNATAVLFLAGEKSMPMPERQRSVGNGESVGKQGPDA